MICANYLDFVDPDNVSVTHLAASSLFHPIEDENIIETAKKKYHIPIHPYMLGLSTLEPRKNIELTIRAFTDLVCQEKIKNLNLVLVGGKGWNFDSIFKEVNLTPDVKERVFFTGFVEDKDLSAIYSGSMAFVYPSLYEGFGLPPLEAMQCGIPVITSDNSSLPEVVGDAGIMIDANDKEALCHAVLDLYRSPGLRETMKKKSVKQAKKFSWERCTDETINAYEKALGKQRMFTSSMVDDYKMNIGINFTGLIPEKIGGMEKYMRAMVHYIPLLSDSHTLFVFLRSETMNEIQESKNVKKVCVRNTPAPDCVDGEIHQLITELDIHIWFSPLLILDPLNPGIPAVYCVPDIQHEYYPEFFSEDVLEWRHKYFEHSAKLADAIFTISDYSKMTLVEKYNVSPDKIHVTWLDCPTYFTIDKAFRHSEYVKTEYNLPDRYILFPANTWPHKNHITLIKALESYHSCYGSPPDLVLTGYESDAHAALLRAIKNSVVKEKIHFLGYVDKDHMPAIYKNASCLVFPSMYEGFGIPLVEAMRTECPIIAANNTTMKEIAGDAAIYFDTMDEIELSVCIKYMMNEKQLGKALIEKGKKRTELFSFEKCAEKTLRVMEDIYATHVENQNEKDFPLVSVITPSYNQGKYIAETIESVVCQDYPRIEYIIMDGGSTDDSVEIIKKYAEKYPDMITWTSGPDKGQTDAINKGLEIAKGDILAYLNSDDVYLPGTIKKVVSIFSEDGVQPKVVYGKANYSDANSNITGVYPTEPFNRDRLLEVCYICQPSVFWKKEVTEKVGLFDASIQYSMDYEYWLRVSEHFEMTYIPELFSVSRLHEENKTLSFRPQIHAEIFEIMWRYSKKIPQGWVSGYAHAIADIVVNEDEDSYHIEAHAICIELLIYFIDLNYNKNIFSPKVFEVLFAYIKHPTFIIIGFWLFCKGLCAYFGLRVKELLSRIKSIGSRPFLS